MTRRPKRVGTFTESLIDWSRSNQSSSLIAGIGAGVCAAMLWYGAGQVAAFSAGAAIILIGVPLLNAVA